MMLLKADAYSGVWREMCVKTKDDWGKEWQRAASCGETEQQLALPRREKQSLLHACNTELCFCVLK